MTDPLSDLEAAQPRDVMFLCGPAKGTKAKPYRCICCGRAYSDPDALAVSICWSCMGGDFTCKACRERGVFVSDFRVGKWVHDEPEWRYDAGGGFGHRLVHLRGKTGVMACGAHIPREHFGGGEAVVPPCPTCWPEPEETNNG